MEFAYVYYKIGIKDFSKNALHDEAYALLDKLLTDKLERTLSSYGEIKIMKSGKPYFEGEDVPYFNISHTKGGVMAGISSSAIGVDIERARPMGQSFFTKCFSSTDLAFIDTVNLTTAPLIPWTYKEAYLKALGTGITGTAMLQGINLPLNHNAPDFSFDYFSEGDYVGSVYVAAKTDIEIIRI